MATSRQIDRGMPLKSSKVCQTRNLSRRGVAAAGGRADPGALAGAASHVRPAFVSDELAAVR